MPEKDFEAAYALIREFKAGRVALHDPVSETAQQLIRLVCDDLGVTAEGLNFDEKVLLAAKTDSAWNRLAQKCMSEYYALQEQGHVSDAKALRADFLAECPSVWYRGIIEGL